MIKHDHR